MEKLRRSVKWFDEEVRKGGPEEWKQMWTGGDEEVGGSAGALVAGGGGGEEVKKAVGRVKRAVDKVKDVGRGR